MDYAFYYAMRGNKGVHFLIPIKFIQVNLLSFKFILLWQMISNIVF